MMQTIESLFWYMIFHEARCLAAWLSAEQSIVASDAILRLFHGDRISMEMRLMGLYRVSRYEEALTYCDAILALHPDDAVAYGVRGDINRSAGDNDAALLAYDHVLELFPSCIAALLHKGRILVGMGHTDAAIEAFDTVIACESAVFEDVLTAYLARGTIYVRSHQLEQLQHLCDNLVARYGESPSMLSMVAAFYCQVGDTETGVLYYRKARDCARRNPAVAAKLTSIIADLEADSVDDETPA